MTSLREQLSERLGVAEEEQPTTALLDNLNQRLQRLAPEAIRGDEAAIAELRGVEDAIAAERRRLHLRELARVEEADRTRIAADAEAEQQRGVWRAEKDEAEAREHEALLKFERGLTSLLIVAKEALEANADAWVASEKLGSGNVARLNMLMENRLVRRIQEELGPKYGIRPGMVIVNEGRTPLAIEDERVRETGEDDEASGSRICSVCVHGDADAINAALDARDETGEGLRAIGERFGVSKSTLSRHLAHHGG